jgi:hypothetical protein
MLTPAQLQDIRNRLENSVPVTYTKPVVNAAIQAVEAWLDSPAVRSAINSAIDAATAPTVLTPAQKLALIKHWLRVRTGD